MKYTLLLSLLLFFSCSPKQYSAKNFTEVSVGQGGGFTGTVTEYTISSIGKVHKIEGLEQQSKEAGQFSPKTLQKLDKQLKSLNLTKYTYSQPGNYSHFIKLRNDSNLHTITWADGSEEKVRPDVLQFYQWLMKEVRALEGDPAE